MSSTKETLADALSGREIVTPVEKMEVPEVDWSQYGDVEDLDPEVGIRSRRGIKPSHQSRRRASSEFVPMKEDEEILNSMGANGLHNAALPEHRIQQEKTDHRFLQYLFAQGKGVKEVFLQMGGKWDDSTGKPLPTKLHGGKYSYAHLTQIRRQPWFQKAVLELMKSEGVDAVTASFQNEFQNSLETVIAVRDDVDEKGATRLAAANSLIDRFLGKPTQHIKKEVTSRSLAEIAGDKEALDADLLTIEAEIESMNPKPIRTIN